MTEQGTRVTAMASKLRHCRHCGNVIPLARGRRAYCTDDCRRAGDNARHRERYKAKTEIYAALGLGGQSGKPSCNDLLAAGYDRYCPVCERNYKPGESKTCVCATYSHLVTTASGNCENTNTAQ